MQYKSETCLPQAGTTMMTYSTNDHNKKIYPSLPAGVDLVTKICGIFKLRKF